MEMILSNDFQELTQDQMVELSGGFVVAVVAIGAATYTITSGMCVTAVATAYAVGATAYEIYNAFR